MSRHLIICVLLIFGLLSACDSPAGKVPADTTIAEHQPAADEDQLLLRLSADLIAEPHTRAELDQNAIINHAIEHELDVQSAPEGYYYQVVAPGEGALLQWGDRIQLAYRGQLLNGQVFDQADRQQPLTSYIGNLIPAMNQALQQLRPDGRMILLAPSAQAYGSEGVTTAQGRTIIPPDAVLLFELHVLQKLAD